MAKAKRRPAFTITINGAATRIPLKFNLSRPVLGVILLVCAALIYLAGLSIYTILTQNNDPNGYNLSINGSSSVREQELENQISQLKNTNNQLQQDNAKYKQDIADLDTRVKQLADSIETLKTFAKQLQDKLGVSSAEPPPIPNSTPSGAVGGDSTAYFNFGGSGYGNSASDVAAAQSYYTQYTQVLAQLQNVNQTITAKQQSINTFGQQLQQYQNQLQQTIDTFNLDAQRTIDKNVTADYGPPTDVPVNGIVTSPFGWRNNPFKPGTNGFHYGIDLAVPLLTPVHATKAGFVTYAGYDNSYGWRIEINHGDGWLTLYAHNTTLLVKVGQHIDKDAIIALSGSTGASTGPHVHYEMHYNNVPVDPALYIKVPLKYDTNIN